MLTEAQRLAREGKLTGSRVACLMEGDKIEIMQLWREMCGDPTTAEENVDDVWAAQLGSYTEPLNLLWYEKIKQRGLIRRGEVVQHPDYEWAAATLDAYDLALPGPVECKHVGGFEKLDTILARYQPQIQWQMACTKSPRCAFSVIEGARKPRIEIIEFDEGFATELISRGLKFMEHVWNMTPPVALDPVVLQRIDPLKDYDMTGKNLWAAAASDWIGHKVAAEKFETAKESLKEQMPNDARQCSGYGVVATRDRANRISIRNAKDDSRNPLAKR